MNRSAKNDLGKQGEIIAANYLAKNSYEILDTNFSNELGYRRGEVDIIAKDPENGELVFVEVKTRKKSLYSQEPEQAITRPKYRRLSRAISNYLNRNRLHGCDYRLDAISVEIDPEKRTGSVKHLKYIYY